MSERNERDVEQDACGCHWDDPCLCVFEGPANRVRVVRYSASAVQSVRAMGLRRFPISVVKTFGIPGEPA